jgi:HAD superfamily hydrolase (TIGR01484 family)
MKHISEFRGKLQFLATDIDDTLTSNGQLLPEAYSALWDLKHNGVQVIPITGRPAGWCELIARQWPVAGVIGENGAFYFRYHAGKMLRSFAQSEQERLSYKEKLKAIEKQILTEVRGSAVASDQFCRLFDLAIDFCEDVPKLKAADVQKIVQIFETNGAQAKVSSIHVNGWFGHFNKLTQTLNFLNQEFHLSPEQCKNVVGFSGDSPNDEPMFEFFPHSFGVANIKDFTDLLKTKPTYLADLVGGKGFAQIAMEIIENLKK